MLQTLAVSAICGGILGYPLAHVITTEDQRNPLASDSPFAKGPIYATSITSYLIGGIFAALALLPMRGNPGLKRACRLLIHLAVGTIVYFIQVKCWDILLNKLQEQGLQIWAPRFN